MLLEQHPTRRGSEGSRGGQEGAYRGSGGGQKGVRTGHRGSLHRGGQEGVTSERSPSRTTAPPPQYKTIETLKFIIYRRPLERTHKLQPARASCARVAEH
eukprot:2091937-Pyramimonas_sp.AAC.3